MGVIKWTLLTLTRELPPWEVDLDDDDEGDDDNDDENLFCDEEFFPETSEK